MASLFKWDPAVGGRFRHLGLQASMCQDSNSAGSWASEWRGEHLQVLTEGGECHPRKASSRGDARDIDPHASPRHVAVRAPAAGESAVHHWVIMSPRASFLLPPSLRPCWDNQHLAAGLFWGVNECVSWQAFSTVLVRQEKPPKGWVPLSPSSSSLSLLIL